MNLAVWCRQALMQLTPAHYNAFIYIISFLREVLKHTEQNQLSALELVLVFSGALTHSVPQQDDGQQSKPKAWTILEHFLTSDEFV